MAESGLVLQLAWIVDDQAVLRDLTLTGVASGINLGQLRKLPAFCQSLPTDAENCAVAVFGRRCRDSDPVFDGDRLEFLPPLKVDPKLARQRRADVRRRAQPRDRWDPDRR